MDQQAITPTTPQPAVNQAIHAVAMCPSHCPVWEKPCRGFAQHDPPDECNMHHSW